MPRHLLLAVVLAVLAAPPLARADGPPLSALPNASVRSPDGRLTIATHRLGDGTLVRALVARREVARRLLRGVWGVPLVTVTQHGGFAPDGRSVMLATIPRSYPPAVTRFLLLPATLRGPARRFTLRGDYGFDALSPDGGTAFLIERVTAVDPYAYRVRALDLRTGRLRPRPVFDRVDHEWKMSGWAQSRTVASRGAAVYTLYVAVQGTAFVHALDAVHGTARCIDLPWRDPRRQRVARLTLRRAGRRLEILDGRRVVAVVDRGRDALVRSARVA